MNDDRAWDRIVDAIDIKFGIAEHGRTTRPVHDAQNLQEHISFIIFERAGERFKLERITSPAIIDRRSLGSRRIGGDSHMQNIYDPEELSHKTLVYRHQMGDWVPIELEDLGL